MAWVCFVLSYPLISTAYALEVHMQTITAPVQGQGVYPILTSKFQLPNKEAVGLNDNFLLVN